MWVDLVRMREAGAKRPREHVLRDPPERGRLTLERVNSSEVAYAEGALETAAFFTCKAPDAPYDIRHRLHMASVSRVGEDSFVVVGIERIRDMAGRSHDSPQAWWCRPVKPPS